MRVFASPAQKSVTSQVRRKRLSFAAGYLMLAFLVLVAFRLSLIFGAPHAAATIVLFVLIAVALTRPAIALGIVIPLTIIGDPRAMAWWPVDKNLSSAESLMFSGDALTIKPLEIMLFVILAVVIINQMVGRSRARADRAGTDGEAVDDDGIRGPMFFAVMVLGATVLFGVVWGLIGGGNLVAALLEAIWMLYVPMVFVAARMLFTTIDHYRRLLIGILIAIAIESLHAVILLPRLTQEVGEGNSPLAHTAALQINMLFLALAGTLVLRRKAAPALALMILGCIPTLWIFVEAQRRSAIVGVALGLILLGTVLFHVDRRRFKLIAPAVVVVGVLYTGAFWNSQGGVGIGAQTIRNIVAPESKSVADATSDLYREVETFNLQVTIRSSPILGFGYGREFLQPIPLPKISNFIFATISPHNAILGLWVKTGLAGILSYVFLIASGVAQGVRSILDSHSARDRVVLLVFVANLPMTFIISFVEIAFDAPTTSVLGVSLALAASSPALVRKARQQAGLAPSGSIEPDSGTEIGNRSARTTVGV